MPESPQTPDEKISMATRRGIRWDALAAIIAALIGLLALCVSGYTAYIERQQVRAQVWPHLDIGASTFPPSIVVKNQGVGPAIVRSVEVLVNGKPQPDWAHVFATVGMRGDIDTQGPPMGGYVLTPGQIANWVNFEFTRDQYQSFKDAAKASSTGKVQPVSSAPVMSYESFAGRQRVLFNQFLNNAKHTRFQVRICYCSTLGECSLATWAAGHRAQQAKECKAVPATDQFRE
ncbi:MAG: hypothetical protein JSR56_09830 [Proteobacteria bacterium]|nr:hypothetical protein [Pseudomonadota bacterium]